MDTKEIRKNLKNKLGYNARQVSISSKHSTIKFTIRDESVNYDKLKEFSETFKSVGRDQATGCILRGGNTFVRVDFSDKVRESLTRKHLKAVYEASKKIEGEYLQDVEGTNFMIGKSFNGFSLWIKKDACGRHLTEACSTKELAFKIALSS